MPGPPVRGGLRPGHQVQTAAEAALHDLPAKANPCASMPSLDVQNGGQMTVRRSWKLIQIGSGPHLSWSFCVCGATGVRTPDLLHAMENADVQYRQKIARDHPCGSMPHARDRNDGQATVRALSSSEANNGSRIRRAHRDDARAVDSEPERGCVAHGGNRHRRITVRRRDPRPHLDRPIALPPRLSWTHHAPPRE